MAKKLKKKIREICGLNTLDWEARQAKAEQILASTEWKQKICNELIGLSFRELEQTLSGIASERQKKEESYERKLEAYRDGNLSKRPKSMRGDIAGATSGAMAHDKHRSGNTNKSRTLKEILAQVHAPRVCESGSTYQHFKQLGNRHLETQSDDEVLSDSADGDNCPEKQLG